MQSNTGTKHEKPHLFVTELVQLVVPEVGVKLNLIDCGLDPSVLEQVLDLFHTEVGDTNALDKTFIHKLFHLLPGFLHKATGGWHNVDMHSITWTISQHNSQYSVTNAENNLTFMLNASDCLMLVHVLVTHELQLHPLGKSILGKTTDLHGWLQVWANVWCHWPVDQVQV